MSNSPSSGLLRSMSPAFSLLSLSNKDGLSSKEKKYISTVEKLIASFDTSIVEWADHISFLSRLLKALQLNPDTENTKHRIPSDLEISKCLAISLSKQLPSGVHKKLLEVYDYIFSILGPQLPDRIAIWLPGLLPLIAYASMGVKPQLVELFNKYIVTLPKATLQKITRPVLLSLLPSIDDETSDSFNQCLKLVDDLKLSLDNDSHFWNVIFLIVITSNDKRLGALIWCLKRLPSFNLELEQDLKDPQAVHCITPSPNLLIKLLSKGLVDENIFVQRGFFDLLVTNLELKSFVLQDKCDPKLVQELLINASSCVLRKDMSLNRRLWNWLLGPDDSNEQQNSTANPDKLSRLEYFNKYGFENLKLGLSELINGEIPGKLPSEQRIEAFKISLLIMDKWEIGQVLVPQILPLTLLNSYKSPQNDQVLKFANTFFDNIDCFNIWSVFLNFVLEKNLKLCLFILANFNVEEEEMVVSHLPLILLALLTLPDKDEDWLELVLAISNLIPQRAYLPIDHAEAVNLSLDEILSTIKQYYSQSEDTEVSPFKSTDLSHIILTQLSSLIVERIQFIYKSGITKDPHVYKLCEIYADLMNKVPQLDSTQVYSNKLLLQYVYMIDSNETCLDLVFGVGKIFDHLIKGEKDLVKKVVFLQDFLHQLWSLLSSQLSVKFQVEIVRLIFLLETSMSSDYVESSMTSFFLKETSIVEKLNKFNLLWIHSSNFLDNGLFLKKSVELIMDDLQESKNEPFIKNWIMIAASNGNINRFVKILVSSSLLNFSFLRDLGATDDFEIYDYQLNNVINFIKMDKKIIEVLKNEPIIIDNEFLVGILKSNNWEELTNYKSLILEICFKLISLDSQENSNCFVKCLQIIELLIDGSEPKFVDYDNQLLSLALHTNDDLLKIKIIDTVLFFCKISKTKSIPLFKDDEINDDNLILQILLEGILKSNNINVLIPLMKLLSESLTIFKDFIFNMILKISNTIILKINEFFTGVVYYLSNEEVGSMDTSFISSELDQSISLLMNGLEELLSVSHSYLKAHQLDHGVVSNGANAADTSFFGSVIQGVFQLEQHLESDTALAAKKTAVFLSFKNSVDTIYKIWVWSETNSKVNLSLKNNTSGLNDKSLIFIASKFKFRSKKFLEFLYIIEPLEFLESLVGFYAKNKDKLIFKILHILDGSRPNLTLPHFFESITNRCAGPVSVEDKIEDELDELKLSQFLFDYFESLDQNVYEDLFTICNNFFKTILLAPNTYKQIYIEIMKITVLISIGLDSELKKHKKDLNDIFIKILTYLTNNKLKDPLEEEFLKSFLFVIPNLKHLQLETDKSNLCYNSIIGHIQPYLTKNQLSSEVVEECILSLNEQLPNKNWKTLVNDITLGSPSFFQLKNPNLVIYNNLVSKNFENDFEKINEMLIKLTATNSNFLNWNDYTEILNAKKLNLKKIIYLIACCPKNQFINVIGDIINKIKELIMDKDLKLEIYLLMRCLVLKFNETHLSNLWIIIYNDFFKSFTTFLQTPEKFKDDTSLFHACKLLDILICLKPEEFQLDEWLFITDNELDSDLYGLIDLMARVEVEGEESAEFVENKGLPLLLEVESGDIPFLQTQFFSKLSRCNFDNISNQFDQVHKDLLEQDVFNDLFS